MSVFPFLRSFTSLYYINGKNRFYVNVLLEIFMILLERSRFLSAKINVMHYLRMVNEINAETCPTNFNRNNKEICKNIWDSDR